MAKITKLTVFLGVLTLLILGCSQDQNPITQSELPGASPANLPLISLPAGATLDSAIFSIYVRNSLGLADHTVYIHRITAPWDELTVTYDSFAGSFDPTAVASYTASVYTLGWHHADITSLVQDWLDGTYPDYGILLHQPVSELTYYWASDYAGDPSLRPKLKICYSIGSASECVTIQRGTEGTVADTYINPMHPDLNYGDEDGLLSGVLSGRIKQSLLKFDVDIVPEPAAIGDTVWIDEDQDGIQDAGEPGFPDVTVNLYECGGITPIATTTTDADGFYMFDGLTPGDYFVEFIEPEGYDISPQDQGADDAVDSDADPTTGRTVCTTLDPGEYDPTWDCGLWLVPQEGCTLTIGFWKTHAGFGPQANVVSQYLPIWLGNAGGLKSIAVTDSAIAHDILMRNVYGSNSNGITKLYAQMLGAKLNIAAGADGTDVAAIIAAADDWLATHDYTDWGPLSKPDKKMVLGWMSDFDDYNNGLIGPGHCDD